MPRGGRREGSGRKAGSRNKLTLKLKATLAETAQQFTAEALQTLCDIMRDQGAPVAARATCANSLLDRAYGKPVQATELSGPDGGPIKTEANMSELDVARRIAFLLERAARTEGVSDG